MDRLIGSFYNIDSEILALGEKVESDCKAQLELADRICLYNEAKVLSAFQAAKVSEAHFKGTTGYGYGDRGRDVLDEVYARIFNTEDALVRHNFVSGTHALTVALFGILRPGDVVVSLTGKPYDTMEEVIGIRGEGNGSLRDFGVGYRELALKGDGTVDVDGIGEAVKGAKVAYIQRSRGYSLRPSITIEDIEKIIAVAKAANSNIIVMVDNCYGEFVQMKEPTDVGADIAIGSLIKNPGGSIAQTGGYIVGTKALIELCAYRLTSVGMGKEVGCTLNQSQSMYMGLFFAPSVVCSAVKTSIFATALFSAMGYVTYPNAMDKRTDIIAAIQLGDKQSMVDFCKGIQAGAPVDSFVTPEPWDMPGYDSDVIMAAGAFNMGASIELSADGPIKPPYAVWLQGGVTYNTGKIGVLLAANNLKNGSDNGLKL